MLPTKRSGSVLLGFRELREANEQPFGATYLLSGDSDKLVAVESLLDSLTLSEESWLSR